MEVAPQEPVTEGFDLLTEPQIESLVDQYRREMARYEKAANVVADRVRRELRAEARLRHLISFRAKHPDDLREKLRLKAAQRKREYNFDALQHNINDVVTDLAGCRVIVYGPDDEERVVELIDRVFTPASRADACPAPIRRPTGYRATHRLILAADSEEDVTIAGAICEVQVTTLAGHLFNELEHDVTYKEHGQKPSASEKEWLQDVLNVTTLTDRLVRKLLHEHEESALSGTVLADSSSLRFALEREVGRPLSGEFARLHRMLDATINPLTRTSLRALGDVNEVLARGDLKAVDLALVDADDVVRYVLGLSDLLDDFVQHAASWRGPKTPLRRALDAVGRASEQGLDATSTDAQSDGAGDA